MYKRMVILVLCLQTLAVSAIAQTPTPQQYRLSRNGCKVDLGYKYFFDRRLSVDQTTSCADCHDPSKGWAEHRPVAKGLVRMVPGASVGMNIPMAEVGFDGTVNTPTILGAAYQQLQFWNQRTDSLRLQALQPLTNPIEMGNGNRQAVLNRLNRIPGYRQLNQEAFGSPDITEETLSEALEAFERTIVSWDAPIDRYYDFNTNVVMDYSAMTPEMQDGFVTFVRSSCIECHTPPFFRDGLCHNTGVVQRFNTGEAGRAGVLGNQATQADIRALKTPTLREVDRTAPYFHAGVVNTLEEVIEHYNRGAYRVVRNGNGQLEQVRDRFTDQRIRPLNLTSQKKANLVSFVRNMGKSKLYPDMPAPTLP